MGCTEREERRMNLRLKEIRQAQNYTLKQVGAHLDKSHATISRWEHELIPVSSTDLLKLAAFFRVSIRDLWYETDTDWPYGRAHGGGR